MGSQSFFGNNLVGQDPWALRGENDGRIQSLETSRIADEANLATITFGAWTAYAPAVTASTANPTGGTGFVQAGRWTRIGRTIVASVRFRFGTGSTAGTGNYRVSLPVTAAAAVTMNIPCGAGYLFHSVGGVLKNVVPYIDITAGGTVVQMLYDGAVVTAAAPWTWADSDEINLFVTYEAAS